MHGSSSTSVNQQAPRSGSSAVAGRSCVGERRATAVGNPALRVRSGAGVALQFGATPSAARSFEELAR